MSLLQRYPLSLFFDRTFDEDLMLFSPRFSNYLSATDDGYLMEVPIPGMNAENVKLHLDEHSIYITAETNKKHKHSQMASKYSFVQTLPRDVDTDSIQASVENGLLTVNMYKLEKKKNVKEIKVR